MESEVDGILVAAHELKAPLALIRQLAFSFDGLNQENENIRTEMIAVSERAIKQVNDLSKVRRLEDGLFEMEPVSIRAVCDEVSHELGQLFSYNEKTLYKKYSNHSKLVTANHDLLYSVIYNFLLNALHYSDKETQAKLLIKDNKGYVKVDIWRELKRGWVEKPVSIAMRPGSSGLGLYIASKFSKYMNAKVGAVRHRDGTSFIVELPISKQASLFV